MKTKSFFIGKASENKNGTFTLYIDNDAAAPRINEDNQLICEMAKLKKPTKTGLTHTIYCREII